MLMNRVICIASCLSIICIRDEIIIPFVINAPASHPTPTPRRHSRPPNEHETFKMAAAAAYTKSNNVSVIIRCRATVSSSFSSGRKSCRDSSHIQGGFKGRIAQQGQCVWGGAGLEILMNSRQTWWLKEFQPSPYNNQPKYIEYVYREIKGSTVFPIVHRLFFSLWEPQKY